MQCNVIIKNWSNKNPFINFIFEFANSYIIKLFSLFLLYELLYGILIKNKKFYKN